MSWLPERRHDRWFINGKVVAKGSWREWWVTHLMAVYYIILFAGCLGSFVGAIIGYLQLWIWYPAILTPISIAVGGLIAAVCLISTVGREITR